MNIKINIASIVSIIFLLSGCSEESVSQKPSLDITNTVEGLKLTIEGSVTNSDGIVTYVEVIWGDAKVDKLTNNDFTSFEASHTYTDPGTYNITIAANDNKGEDVIENTISVTVDFSETSLENIKSGLFKTSAKEYLILTINLHTYQESQQNEKFNLITDLIGEMEIDFVAFQECAQHRSSEITTGIIREDNMAMVIADQLKDKYDLEYNYVWDWAHYGWDVWEEGIAILSKHPLVDTDQRYISANTSTGGITSRKAIYGSYQMSSGKINIISTHTHWRTSQSDQEHNNQINNVKSMASEKEALSSDTFTFVCGDFNVNPTSDYPWSEGYNTMVAGDEYVDTFLEVHSDANNKPAQSKYNTIGGDFPGRIDYIFMKENTRYQVVESQIVFTNDVVGRVSDHFGVITKVIDTE